MAFKASGSIPFISTKTELQSQGIVVLCPIENEDSDTKKMEPGVFQKRSQPLFYYDAAGLLNATW